MTSMSSTAVRWADPADTQALAEVKVRTWRHAYAGLLPGALLASLSVAAERAAWEQSLRQPELDVRAFTVADRVGGFAVSGPAEAGPSTLGELYALYVLPEHQRTGGGRALLAEALKDLRARGCSEAILWVFAENRVARRFYEAAGFLADGAGRTDFGAPSLRYRRALTG